MILSMSKQKLIFFRDGFPKKEELQDFFVFLFSSFSSFSFLFQLEEELGWKKEPEEFYSITWYS